MRRLIFLVFFLAWPMYGQVKATGGVKISGGVSMNGAVASGLGWTDISGQQITQGNCPSPLPPGDDGCAGVVQAWNSAIVDTTRNCLWVWGGGHNDYAGNEIYKFCLGTGLAQRVNTPTVTADLIQGSAAYADGAPSARHTYGGTVYVPTIDSMMVFGGVFWNVAGGFDTHDTWMLNLATVGGAAVNGWTHISPTCVGDGGNCPNDQNGNSQLQYDPVNEVVYLNDASTGFWMFNPATNTYTFLASGPSDLSIHQNTVIDPVHRLFLRFGDGTGQSISIGAGSTYAETQLTMAGCSSLGGGSLAGSSEPGLAWDPVLQVIVGWPNFGPGVYFYNPLTDSCTTATYAANAPPNSAQAGSPNTSNGTYKRFGYFPAYGEYVLVNDWDIDVHTLRLTPASASENNFQARCITPGVLLCQGFDSSASLSGNTAAGVPITSCGLTCPSIDTTTYAAGGGSLLFTVPAGATSANTSGSFNTNFTADMGQQIDSQNNGDPLSLTTACAGLPCSSTIFVQWRQRMDAGMLQSWANSNGFKSVIIGEGDNPGAPSYSCSDLETDTQNSRQFNIAQMYFSCGLFLDQYFDLYTPTGTTDSHGNALFSPENVAGGYLLCTYASGIGIPTVPPCFPYTANNWMTFQIEISVGTWYPTGTNGSGGPPATFKHDSTIKMWAALDGQASELVIDYHPGATSPACDATQQPIPTCQTGFDLSNPTAYTSSNVTPCTTTSAAPGNCQADGYGNLVREKFGKVWMLPYQTNLDCPACTAAHMWMDDLIISRSKIADPTY